MDGWSANQLLQCQKYIKLTEHTEISTRLHANTSITVTSLDKSGRI